MEERTKFADRLRSIRERAGISQYRLAQLSGITKQSLSRLELGETQPSWDTVQKLAIALGVDCQEFIDPSLRTPSKQSPARPRGRPSKAAPATAPATDLEAKAGT